MTEVTLQKSTIALARRLSWLEHHPVHQNVIGSIPGQGTNLGCEFDPRLRRTQEAADLMSLSHIDVSFSPSISLPPISLKKISSGED